MSAPNRLNETVLVEWLRTARRVLVFCGAGVSAESGLPTFRGAGGLWEGHRIEEVATPEAFEFNPELVWRFYAMRQEALPHVEPNAAHRVLAAMEDRYADFLLVTQNVDNLHERAGSSRMLKLHGSLMEVRCTECERITPIDTPVSSKDAAAGTLPHCRCGGLLRPNIVWFGELLNRSHLTEIDAFIRSSRQPGAGAPMTVVLVIGTSGQVSGGYGIAPLARSFGAKVVEINPEVSVVSGDVDLALREPAGALLARVWPQIDPGWTGSH
ncbi:MAG: SIR2 family NAD-dependent protein deacylase [Actinomycetota bacterium]